MEVAVLGSGSWGTALAALLAKEGHAVRMWSFEDQVIQDVMFHGENTKYLPGVQLPKSLIVTDSISQAVFGSEVIVSVSPSQFVDGVIQLATEFIDPSSLICSASKGIETPSLRRMDEIFQSNLSHDQFEGFSVLSGPSFAQEVASEVPTAVVVASESMTAAITIQGLFQTPYFRVYTGSDVIGVELGGALKNVIALAAGVGAGLGYGFNTLAALMTRGLAEMKRLGTAMGAESSTFSGLAGMGDLVLTCTGDLSRNRTVGFRLGSGETIEQILAEMSSVAEGVKTTESVYELSKTYQVEMPITKEVYTMLKLGGSPEQALLNLMGREPTSEE
jgi:glycerol-3-phosphate dehydrogenase (NAD(P)+)